MQRLRLLEVKRDGSFFLTSTFIPSKDDELSWDNSGCRIVYDYRKKNPFKVEKLSTLALELPPLYLVSEEMSFMFNLVKSLLPYELPSSQEITQDF